jgi:hypothetical protein
MLGGQIAEKATELIIDAITDEIEKEQSRKNFIEIDNIIKNFYYLNR